MADQNTTTGVPEKKSEENAADDSNKDQRVFGPDDPELDDLLDSALEDFDLTPGAAKDSSEDKLTVPVAREDEKENVPNSGNPAPDAMFTEAFDEAMSQQAQKEFEDVMKQLMGGDPGMMGQFSQIAQGLGPGLGMPPQAPTGAPPTAQPGAQGQPPNLFETLQQTMGSMAQNAEGLQAEPNEDELAQMMSNFANFNLGEGEGDDELSFMPMMQGMMKSLLSKDVLYPSLKEISGKYPAWLEENKSKLESAEYLNYEKQYKLMSKITGEFETELEGDSEDVKKQRFDRILDHMQEMQELGHPPKEIVGEMPAGMQMDENGMPQFPGGIPGLPGMNPNQQCSIM